MCRMTVSNPCVRIRQKRSTNYKLLPTNDIRTGHIMKNYISQQHVKIFSVGKKKHSMECYSYTMSYGYMYGGNQTEISVQFDQVI